MNSEPETTVVIAFLSDRVAYTVERGGATVSAKGVLKPSPTSLRGRGLRFGLGPATLKQDAKLDVVMLRLALNLQAGLERTPNFFSPQAQPAITEFLGDLMRSAFDAQKGSRIQMSPVTVQAAG